MEANTEAVIIRIFLILWCMLVCGTLRSWFLFQVKRNSRKMPYGTFKEYQDFLRTDKNELTIISIFPVWLKSPSDRSMNDHFNYNVLSIFFFILLIFLIISCFQIILG